MGRQQAGVRVGDNISLEPLFFAYDFEKKLRPRDVSWASQSLQEGLEKAMKDPSITRAERESVERMQELAREIEQGAGSDREIEKRAQERTEQIVEEKEREDREGEEEEEEEEEEQEEG